MAKNRNFFACAIFAIIFLVSAKSSAAEAINTDYLDGLSSNLLFSSNFEKWAENRGVIIASPFGVGYMLVNIHSKVWNVSDDGIEQLFQFPQESIVGHYTEKLEQFKNINVNTTNMLFSNDENSSVVLPPAAQKLQTELIYTDYVNDWNVSWHLMNGLLSNHTACTLDDQLIPITRFLGAAFREDTVGGYISTTYYKGSWGKKWTAVGERNFSDGATLPFYQVEGSYATLKAHNFTAVAVPLEDKSKHVVFVLPEGDFDTFFQEDLPTLLKTNMDPTKWEAANGSGKVQIPKINVTTVRNYFKDLESLGLNDTFCLPTEHLGPAMGIEEAGGVDNYVALRPYFAQPIVQAGHVQLDDDFIELASGTAMTVSSLRKLVADDDDAEHVHGEGGKVTPGKRVRKSVELENSKAKTTMGNTEDKDAVVFDRPFFWYLYDRQGGLIYYGSVNSIQKYKAETMPPSGFEWLVDVAKMGMWNCP